MTMTCGELLVHLLERYGVDTVFGIPGVHTVELYRGLPATRIRHITPRHEQGAGFMADGYARTTGKPGVCFIVTGPGMTNIATAIAQAAADSVPMLVISSENLIQDLGGQEGHLHELRDQRSLIGQLCASSKVVWTPRVLPRLLAEAFNIFSGSRPRPVHIQLPLDVITAPADGISWDDVGARTLPPVPAPAALDEAAAMLRQAKRRVLCYGGGARWVGQETATRLAEILDAPTLLTTNAKGLLPPGHPLSLGGNQSFQPARDVIAAADVVLAIGTEMGQTDYDTSVDHHFPQPRQLIRIDIDPAQLNRSYLAQLAITGDATAAIQGLLQRLPQPLGDGAGATVAAAARRELVAQMRPDYAGQCGVLKVIRDTLPDATIMGDSTQPIYAGAIGFETNAPGRWFNSATGYGTLGYGLPAAIGARLGLQTPVICFAGDGGVQFTLAELMSAVDHKVPVIVVIWNNQGYGEIRDYMKSRGLPTIGVDIGAPDYGLIAKAYGVPYERITSSAGFAAGLRRGAAAEIPTILEIDAADAFVQELGAQYRYFS